METESLIDRPGVLLSLQRALLGEVFPALRTVTAEWTARALKIYFYVDGQLNDSDEGSVFSIAGEVAADFEPEISVSHEVVRCDAPMPVKDDRVWAFSRREY